MSKRNEKMRSRLAHITQTVMDGLVASIKGQVFALALAQTDVSDAEAVRRADKASEQFVHDTRDVVERVLYTCVTSELDPMLDRVERAEELACEYEVELWQLADELLSVRASATEHGVARTQERDDKSELRVTLRRVLEELG